MLDFGAAVLSIYIQCSGEARNFKGGSMIYENHRKSKGKVKRGDHGTMFPPKYVRDTVHNYVHVLMRRFLFA